MFYLTEFDSPIGKLYLAAKDDALAGLWIENQKYFFGSLKKEQMQKEEVPVLRQAKRWLTRYFQKDKPEISELKFFWSGSEFRKRVWNELCTIPYGEVRTYGEIARELARETGKPIISAQAVGGAVGHNEISIIVPCHRVVGADGGLTGYAGGLERKRWLLKHEGLKLKEDRVLR